MEKVTGGGVRVGFLRRKYLQRRIKREADRGMR
jgi:hypothetical protein